jgi:hypothetical protein
MLSLACLLASGNARADRLAVIALKTSQAPAPVLQADALAAHLLREHHRTINHADAVARLQAGNDKAGPAWSAVLVQTLAQARASLTRLDRRGATLLSNQVADAIRREGGGAGAAEVLVEWALLERSLALSSASPSGGSRWLQVAAALGPRVALDPLTHPDDERNALSAAVAGLEKQAPANLTISSTPAGAELWIDGVKRCATPCTHAVLPGHHFLRVSTPAHAPATLEVEVAAGAVGSREVGLSAAYSGASVDAIAAMLADPSRSAEAGSAIMSVSRFLDVNHVIALTSEPGGKLRVVVAPPSAAVARGGLRDDQLPSTVDSILSSNRGSSDGDSGGSSKAWYSRPLVWIGVSAVIGVAAVVTSAILLSKPEPEPAHTGTLVIGGR